MTNCLEAQDLLNRIFVPNPKRRITIAEMLGHPWMQGPCLDDAELKEVMHERNLRIQAIKAREHAMVQRQGGQKRGLGSECGDKKGSVDVFKKNTHRRYCRLHLHQLKSMSKTSLSLIQCWQALATIPSQCFQPGVWRFQHRPLSVLRTQFR